LEDFLGLQGERLKGAIRLWLWRLHENINKRREEPVHYTFEDLEKYREVSAADLNQTYKTLVQILAKAVLHRQVNPTVVVDWKRAVGLLRRLIGF
jgi:hypothetical protein